MLMEIITDSMNFNVFENKINIKLKFKFNLIILLKIINTEMIRNKDNYKNV